MSQKILTYWNLPYREQREIREQVIPPACAYCSGTGRCPLADHPWHNWYWCDQCGEPEQSCYWCGGTGNAYWYDYELGLPY